MLEEVNKSSYDCLAMVLQCFAQCLPTFLLLIIDQRLLSKKRHCVSVYSRQRDVECGKVAVCGDAAGRGWRQEFGSRVATRQRVA